MLFSSHNPKSAEKDTRSSEAVDEWAGQWRGAALNRDWKRPETLVVEYSFLSKKQTYSDPVP